MRLRSHIIRTHYKVFDGCRRTKLRELGSKLRSTTMRQHLSIGTMGLRSREVHLQALRPSGLRDLGRARSPEEFFEVPPLVLVVEI